MTGILEQQNTMRKFLLRAVFLPRFGLFYLSQHWLPRLFLHHSSRNFSHRLTVWVKCHGRHLTGDVCVRARVCMCGGVHVYFKPLCSCFGMCSSFFQRKEDSGTKRCAEPKKARLVATASNKLHRLTGLDIPCKHVLQLTGSSINAQLHTDGQVMVL